MQFVAGYQMRMHSPQAAGARALLLGSSEASEVRVALAHTNPRRRIAALQKIATEQLVVFISLIFQYCVASDALFGVRGLGDIIKN